jgi:hypothetical protein
VSPGDGGSSGAVACWRWSNTSLEDAQSQANSRAAELARKFQAGEPLDRYGYGQRAMREEIIQTIAGDGRPDSAVVTRNAYGALVLNTLRAMFIDVDISGKEIAKAGGGILRRLFSRASEPIAADQIALGKIRDWAARQSHLGLRVYRTRAGFRCLVTSRTFDVAEPETSALLESVGSDPLYVRLCSAQRCFRARLTPKPWRCGMPIAPGQYPRTNAEAESAFRRWQSNYERASHGLSVCRFLEHLGPTEMHPDIGPILVVHDRFTCGQQDQPLA